MKLFLEDGFKLDEDDDDFKDRVQETGRIAESNVLAYLQARGIKAEGAGTTLSDEQKLEALAPWEIEEWNTAEASKFLGVSRATLLGWRSSKEQIDERTTLRSRVDPDLNLQGMLRSMASLI
ncbi:unnamed protein product [Phytophthora fragariaefolia]|uniref:Unnamed protein product n=1 Tax=Phytophthora fragariaefolia TaxID=1490495 RepID=A0A9W6XZ04_9STRA|nr:unnamed protein product [Phytophthora fragariaefolia]